jgi:glycosyltransferase involved in cell wall biosynthesis
VTKSSTEKPALLVVLYAAADNYPPTFNAVYLLREHFRVRVLCTRDTRVPALVWPDDVCVDRVGPEISGADQIVAPARVKLRLYLGFIQAVRRALAEDQPALVYAYEPHALTAVALAGRRSRVVYHRHEAEEPVPFNPRSLQGWVFLAARRLARRAELVVFPEAQRAKVYQRLAGDPRPPLIVPNFPRREAFPAPDFAALFDARWSRPVAHYRGAIGVHNGIFQMVRALPHLDARVSLRLSGVAEPELVRAFSELAASLGVAERVRYDGYVPYPALNRETVHAAVGLVLYQPVLVNWEHCVTAINKLFEYAACGLPVVVPERFRRDLPGEEWVEYTDVLDPEAVARALGAVLADRARYEARARAARRAFEERFNFEAVFEPLREQLVRLAR